MSQAVSPDPMVPAELDELDTFLKAVSLKDQNPNYLYPRVGMLHCPKCGGVRRMDMGLKYRVHLSTDLPILAILCCGQCDTRFTAVAYDGPGGPALAVLPSTSGGLTTPHTPPSVA